MAILVNCCCAADSILGVNHQANKDKGIEHKNIIVSVVEIKFITKINTNKNSTSTHRVKKLLVKTHEWFRVLLLG